MAVMNGHFDVVDELLANEADVGLQDGSGYSILHRAAEKGHVSIVTQLLGRGASISVKDNVRFTDSNLTSPSLPTIEPCQHGVIMVFVTFCS